MGAEQTMGRAWPWPRGLVAWLLAVLMGLLAACGGGGGGGGDGAAAIQPPQITTQPAASASADDAGSATFSVAGSGSGARYQWQRNGTDVPGATSASYTLSPATLADNGSRWRVVVSNDGGSVTSSETVLTVRAAAPRITAAPAAVAVSAGQAAAFSVTATGSAPLAYQWQRGGVDIAGATASSYTLAAAALADSGASFHVRVSNGAGSVSSANVTLTVNAPVQVAGQARLSVGALHVVAVRADGSVIAWGSNNAGQLGNGPAITGTNARSVATTAVAVAGGNLESLALGSDGIVRGWGTKFPGLTIIGGDLSISGTAVPSPAASAFPGGVTHVVASVAAALVRRSDGTVWHMPGALTSLGGGNGNQAARQVEGLNNVASLGSIGVGSTGDPTAIRSDGSLWRITLTSLGSGNTQGVAAPVAGVAGAVASSCNSFGCIVLTAGGGVLGFGNTGGTGPAAVAGLPAIVQVASTQIDFLALAADGRLWRWDGSRAPAPALVAGLDSVVEVAGGVGVVLARRVDGSVWGYGGNDGQLGAANIGGFVPLPAPLPGINLN